MFRRLTPAQLTFDIAIAALCFLIRGTMTFDAPVIWVFMAGALAIRRLSPGLALAVAWAGAVLQMALTVGPDVSNIAILAVLFATARYGSARVRWLGLASAIGGAVIASAYTVLVPGIFGPADSVPAFLRGFSVSLIGALAVLGLSWTLGLLWRTWDTARQNRRDKLAAEQATVVEQERNRIARDMHDVIAHSLAVVIAQSDGGRYSAGLEAKDAALTTISSTAREALADVRLLLGQLRHSQETGPQPMLADLDRLVEQLRASGLTIRFAQEGEPVPLPAGKQLAIYRIVQEGLTNALRHGVADDTVDLLIEWSREAVTITIENTASGEPGPQGHGLAGMHERALLVGGTFRAAPDDGRFVVSATIPVLA